MKKKQNFEIIFANALKCNHCGMCLQNCPAYRKNKEEISSPRGRVQIVSLLIKKKINPIQDRQALLKCIKTCQNCFNCAVLCPAGINPCEINQKLKNILSVYGKYVCNPYTVPPLWRVAFIYSMLFSL